MNRNRKSYGKRIVAMLMTMVLLCGCATSTAIAASTGTFTDVPTDNWAYTEIEALAEGGLVNGYGGGTFGPSDGLTIAQVATVICNAKGITTGSENGFWAYDAVDYCITNLILPSQGTINADNYSVACSREVAVYMIVKGLGSSGKTTTNNGLTYQDIPDYNSITWNYATTILDAYKLGIVQGSDAAGTFNPKENLTRAQLCVILYRAGWTEAMAKVDDSVATGMTAEEMYYEIITWDGWEVSTTYFNGEALEAKTTDPLYGGIWLGVGNGLLQIQMSEDNQSAWISNGVLVDKWGNVIDQSQDWGAGWTNSDGARVVSSGWSYEARQQVKAILELAYPTASEELYQAMLDTMCSEIHEIPSSSMPAALRWEDGRAFSFQLAQNSHAATLTIGGAGNTVVYESDLKAPSNGVESTYYPSSNTAADIPTMYEFAKG